MRFYRAIRFSFAQRLSLLVSVSASLALSATPNSSYVGITPCRVLDTRNAAGTFGGPSLAVQQIRVIPVPSSACNIPANASAYALNITIVPPGTPVYVFLAWPDGQPPPNASTVNDFQGGVVANGAIIAAGNNGAIDIAASSGTDVVIDINGYFLPEASPSTSSASTALGTGASNSGSQNTAIGYNTLQSNNGISNTAVGAYSLAANSSGNNNTAVGASALLNNALGSSNTAIGTETLLSNLTGNSNTAVGFSALDSSSTGSANVALGATSLWTTTSGSYNVAIGTGALFGDTTGSWNIALGYNAGNAITSGNANIEIGNTGYATDSGVIRIGTTGSQTSTYIAGIVTSTMSGAPVVVNASGQLGIQTSSARFKKDVEAIGDDSDALLRLRPVKFHYRADEAGDRLPLQYGLIAEEVEKIFPELVLHDQFGQPFALAYQELPALLLNELQKQRHTIEEQQERIAAQDTELKALSDRLSRLEKTAAADLKQ